MRRFVSVGKIVDQRLRIFRPEVYDTRELASQVWIVGVKAFRDEHRVVVIFGEDDGLA